MRSSSLPRWMMHGCWGRIMLGRFCPGFVFRVREFLLQWLWGLEGRECPYVFFLQYVRGVVRVKLNPCHVFCNRRLIINSGTFQRGGFILQCRYRLVLLGGSAQLFAKRIKSKYSFPLSEGEQPSRRWFWLYPVTCWKGILYLYGLSLNGCVVLVPCGVFVWPASSLGSFTLVWGISHQCFTVLVHYVW